MKRNDDGMFHRMQFIFSYQRAQHTRAADIECERSNSKLIFYIVSQFIACWNFKYIFSTKCNCH